MELYVKCLLYPHLLFFLVFKRDFNISADFKIFQLQTQQVMTSQIRSHEEYLIQTYYILVLIL